MPASEVAVAAVMKALGCEGGTVICLYHREYLRRDRDRGCPVAVAAADAAVEALGLTWESKAHTRTGPGKCSCGFDAYRNAPIMADYHALTQAHFRAVERGLVPTGRRLVGPWEAKP